MEKIKIYTDGACAGNPGLGGWGSVIIINDIIVKELGERHFHHTTNQIMELAAAENSLDYVMQNLYTLDTEIIVYTDSAYLYNCWKDEWWKKWRFNGWLNSKKEPVANKHLWEVLIPYFEKSYFSIVKVKGHSGNQYNEIADQLATGTRLPKV